MISSENSNLELVAHHGFHFKERLENVILDVNDVYQKEIIGLGNSLVIPNLQRSNQYNISALVRMGYHWLVAVPMRNHRLAGIMSVASRNKRKINGDFGEFMEAIAGLAIMTYEKTSEKMVEIEQHEDPVQNTGDTSMAELTTHDLFGLNSNLDRHTAESSPRETDLLDAIYSGKDSDQIAARFNSDVETVRNDIESIRNKLIEDYRTRRFTETIQQDPIPDKLLGQNSPSAEYVTREEFNQFKESLKTFLANTLALLDDL